YAHDGMALGECMTYSIGFRAPDRGELGRELLQRLAEDAAGSALYRDAAQQAVDSPGRIPAMLQEFAGRAVQAALKDSRALPRALGEYLTEPKARVWFDAARAPTICGGSARTCCRCWRAGARPAGCTRAPQRRYNAITKVTQVEVLS